MAKIKFKNTYELIKYLFLKDILKGYYVANRKDGGSGSFPKIENSEIENILFNLFEHSKLEESYASIDIDLKIEEEELIVVETRNFNTSSESWDFDLYPELIEVLSTLELVDVNNDEVTLECQLNHITPFELKKYNDEEGHFKDLKINNEQKKTIIEHLKKSFFKKSDVFYESENNIDDFELSIDINITSFSSNDDDETDEEEADEYIKNMINYGDFNDQSYEFEEDEIK